MVGLCFCMWHVCQEDGTMKIFGSDATKSIIDSDAIMQQRCQTKITTTVAVDAIMWQRCHKQEQKNTLKNYTKKLC